eukprot:scaffold362033_cov11-Prasinocladus_malaysianus.AAC.1
MAINAGGKKKTHRFCHIHCSIIFLQDFLLPAGGLPTTALMDDTMRHLRDPCYQATRIKSKQMNCLLH